MSENVYKTMRNKLPDVPEGYSENIPSHFDPGPIQIQQNSNPFSEIIKNEQGEIVYSSKKLTLRDLGLYMTKTMNDQLNDDLLSDENGETVRMQAVQTDELLKERLSKTNEYEDLTLTEEEKSPESIHSLYYDPETKDFESMIKKRDKASLRMGYSEVLNPHWQFNDLDDVRSNPYYPRFGRVYNDYIRSNWPVVVFEPNYIKYRSGFANTLNNLLSGSKTNSAISYIRGDNRKKIGKIFSDLIGVIGSTLTQILGVNKAWKMKSDIDLFRRIFNELIGEAALIFGLISTRGKGLVQRTNDENKASKRYQQLLVQKKYGSLTSDETTELHTLRDKIKGVELKKSTEETEETDEDEEYQTKLDIITGGFDYATAYDLEDSEIPGFGGHYMGGAKNGKLHTWNILPDGTARNIANGTVRYIPFLYEKGSSMNETLSSSFSSNPVADQVNAKAVAAEQSKQGAQENIKDAAAQELTNLKNMFLSKGFLGGNSALAAGGGRMYFPEIWTDSSFSRTISLDFNLFSPYGDKLSKFESVIIPLMALIALSFPRGVSNVGYTNPFYLRVFSRGMFQINIAMVESISITRGEIADGRTPDGIPRSMKVAISLKDMVPNIMVNVDAGIFSLLKRHNDGMRQYMMTLGGLDIADQDSLSERFNRFFTKILFELTRGSVLKDMIGKFSTSFIAKPFIAFSRGKIDADTPDLKARGERISGV